MLLMDSLTETKKLFHKTIQRLKYLLYGGYQRLPKTTRCMKPFSSHYARKLKIHDSCRDEKEAMKENKVENEGLMKLSKERSYSTRGKQENFKQSHQLTSRRKDEGRENQKRKRNGGNKREKFCCERSVREAVAVSSGSNYLVAKKLRELELIMGMKTDVEHVLDMEELIHYYSRLTCPVYLDIVDKFFTDMYSEFLQPRTSTGDNNSRRLRFMKS